MTVETSEDFELFHYGVKGMKWGVRKDRTAAKADRAEAKSVKNEAKAQKYDKRAQEYQAAIDRISSKPAKNWLIQEGIDKDIQELSKLRDRAINDASLKREGKMSSGEKKLAIGAAAVATYAGYRVVRGGVEGGDFHRLALKGKAFREGKETYEFKKDHKLSRPDLDIDDIEKLVVSKVNPEYGKIGTKMNCRRTTFAYEMRRRGYDVAATKTTNAKGQDAAGLYNTLNPWDKNVRRGVPGILARFTKESVTEKLSNGQASTPFKDFLESEGGGMGKNKIPAGVGLDNGASIFSALSEQPNGARGELGVQWSMGGGHSVAWEVIKGKPVVIDNQDGSIYKTPEDFNKKLGKVVTSASYTRLDNIELDDDFLLKWLKDAD